MRSSLRVQLLAGVLGPLAVVLLVLISAAHRDAASTARTVTDRMLLGSARTIAEQIRFGENGVEAMVPPSALSMFDFGEGDTVYYRVTTSDGHLLAGYLELAPPPRSEDTQPRYYDARFRNEPIRLVAIRQEIPTNGQPMWATVVVAETLNGREAMTKALWMVDVEQQAILVIMASALAWFALRRGLAPLMRFSQAVADRQPNEFRPFSADEVQSELRPMVAALNEYMHRLLLQLEAQRRFTDNAAHQLRTPLTLLRTQASFALRSAVAEERQEATRAILATTRQITRLTNQLLSLARVEPDGHTAQRARVDLAELTRAVLEEHGSLAVDRHVDLGFDVAASAPHVFVEADPAMLRDLIVNVVDNALRATPQDGHVTVSVTDDGEYSLFRVEDTGPGIPVAHRELVFERFYRLRSDDSEGSGLGLAIVKEIVAAHGGTISLSDRADGPGLVVEVRLPGAVDRAGSGPDVAEGRRPPLEEPVLHPG
ncbi:MAG: integral rane sensor signal transduction histidine kinase [Candidatus Eremiobacteraeota bacterium]|nr:integral rane sensor signal transduction histidine kinase [Candidatus Eremiobacteraeota bacterium]